MPSAALRKQWSSQEPRAPAHTHCAELEAADIKNVESDNVSFAYFAQHVFRRNFAVIQNDGTSGRSTNAHLVLFRANGKSREALFNQKCRELFAIHFGENREQIGKAGIGDPHLFAV